MGQCADAGRELADDGAHRWFSAPDGSQFVREVNAELRKVAWPSRPETINLSVIVLIFLVVMTALIAGFDYGFSKAVLFIVDQ